MYLNLYLKVFSTTPVPIAISTTPVSEGCQHRTTAVSEGCQYRTTPVPEGIQHHTLHDSNQYQTCI
jgi:hypothetical protein